MKGVPRAGGVLLAAVLLLALPAALADEGADWRFGKGLRVARLKEGYWLRFSLRNWGVKSEQPVALYAVLPETEPDGPNDDDEPELDLSKRTKNKRSVVFDGPIELEGELLEANRVWLYMVVGGQVTDLLPIVGGEPDEDAAVRRKLHRALAKRGEKG